MKYLKKQYDLVKEELKSSQDKIESLKWIHIALGNKDDKPLSEHEISLQEFITISIERTKLSSMFYEVSKSKWEGMGYNKRSVYLGVSTLKNHSDPYSLSNAQTEIKDYFDLAAENSKILNQLEPKTIKSKFLGKLESMT